MKQSIADNIDSLINIAILAGQEILEVYKKDFEVEQKMDNSPLTEADKRSNDAILRGLQQHFGDLPYISEETKLTEYAVRKDWKGYWLIDPLDGTKEFVKKNGEFTVNIAWVENGQPEIGVVHIPVTGVTYVGVVGQQAFLQKADGSRESLKPQEHYKNRSLIQVVGSRSHMSEETQAFVDALKASGKEVEFKSSGSSIKLCLVADGTADVYPRFGPTMEWDTAAAQAVVLAAGKKVLRYPEMTALDYNKENLLNPWFIVE